MKLILPVGIMHEGARYNEFTLVPVTGKLRVALNDAPPHIPGIDICALRHVIGSIGPVVGSHDSLIRRLTLPDRDYIHAANTAKRHGGNIPVRGVCGCGEKLEDSVAADAIGMLDPEAEIQWTDNRACVALTVKLPECGRMVSLVTAIPTIANELKVAEARQAKKKAEGDIYIERMADCIMGLDGKTVTAKDLREMALDDFDAILAAMDEIKVPRLDGEAILRCSACGSEVTLPLMWDEWIVPLGRRTVKGS